MSSPHISPRNAVLRFGVIIKWLVKDSRALADKLLYLLENPQVAAEFGVLCWRTSLRRTLCVGKSLPSNRFSPSAAGGGLTVPIWRLRRDIEASARL